MAIRNPILKKRQGNPPPPIGPFKGDRRMDQVENQRGFVYGINAAPGMVCFEDGNCITQDEWNRRNPNYSLQPGYLAATRTEYDRPYYGGVPAWATPPPGQPGSPGHTGSSVPITPVPPTIYPNGRPDDPLRRSLAEMLAARMMWDKIKPILPVNTGLRPIPASPPPMNPSPRWYPERKGVGFEDAEK